MIQSWDLADFPFGIEAVALPVQDQVGVVDHVAVGERVPMPHSSPSG